MAGRKTTGKKKAEFAAKIRIAGTKKAQEKKGGRAAGKMRAPAGKTRAQKNGPLAFEWVRPDDGERWPALSELIAFLFPNSKIRVGNGHRFMAAFWKGRPVGFAHIHPLRQGACIRGIGVRPDWRHRGIGTQLMARSLMECERRYGRQPVMLKVKEANAEALRLYAKLGFLLSKSEGNVFVLRKAALN